MNKLQPGSIAFRGFALLALCLMFAGGAQAATPATPTGLAATAPSGRVVLSWTASSDATSYNVKRTMTSGGPYYQLANVASSSFTDYGVLNGNTYYYVVSAVNSSGESSNTSQVSGTPGASATLPGAPSGLSASPGNAQVSLTWTAGSGATSYRVKRGTSSGGPYTQVATPGSNSYTDTAVANGTAYYYVVSAVNSAGESGNSGQASATPTAPATVPATPTGLSATGGNAQISLGWAASSGATSYRVKRGTSSGGPYTQIATPGSTSYTDTAVTNGTTYYYVVSAVNSAGESGNSPQANATPTGSTGSGIPATPTGLAASAGNGRVNLNWGASSGATSYNVKRTMSSGGPYYQLANVNSTSFNDHGVLNGNTYYYVVSAVNSSGESSNTSQVSGTPGTSATVPAAPSGLSAVAGNTQVSLSWAASSGATGYRVKRATSSGGPYTQIAAPGSTSHTDTTVTNGTTYYYVVTATNSAGESGNSSQASATPTAPATVPAAPGGLAAAGGNAQVSLTWAASSGATSYRVKRGTSSGGPYTQIATPGSTSYTDTAVTNGTAYYYVVSAVNSAGESGNSGQASATPSAPVTVPAAPGGLSATGGNAQISLGWAASSGATSYRVKRGTSSGGPYTQIATPGSTSYTDTAVANGTTYYYVVTAANSAGESGNSPQAAATPVATTGVPATPGMFMAVSGNGRVGLSWAASSGATSYNVKRTMSSGGPYYQLANVTANSFTDFGVLNDNTYYYVVSAVNSSGESGNTAQVSGTPTASSATVPAAPGGLSAVAGNTQVSLSWTASSGATGYRVKRATSSGGPYTQITAPGATSYTDTTVANGTTYYYVVTATNSAGESGNSSQASATPTGGATIPAAPTGLSAAASSGRVSLSWGASSGATSYRVKRSTSSGGPYTQIAAPTSTSHADTAVSNGTAYYYVVTAVNSAGESGNSGQASATPASNVTLFFDDFDGSSIDTAKWSVVSRLSDQVNGELDCVLAENVSVRNGLLEGVSKFEDRTCGDSVEPPKLMHYTSWNLQQKTPSFLYGTIEVRARMPGGTGLWPLIWMLGYEWQASQPYTANTPGHQWPNGGWSEIDIAEFMGGQRRENNTVVHFNQGGGSWNSTLPYDANTRFMVYRLQWSASALTWSVDAEDGQGFRTLRTITDPARIPNVPMYVVLSTAIGGIGGGSPNPGTFPQTYLADWVRVTQ